MNKLNTAANVQTGKGCDEEPENASGPLGGAAETATSSETAKSSIFVAIDACRLLRRPLRWLNQTARQGAAADSQCDSLS